MGDPSQIACMVGGNVAGQRSGQQERTGDSGVGRHGGTRAVGRERRRSRGQPGKPLGSAARGVTGGELPRRLLAYNARVSSLQLPTMTFNAGSARTLVACTH